MQIIIVLIYREHSRSQLCNCLTTYHSFGFLYSFHHRQQDQWHVHWIEMGCFSAKSGKENDEERSRREANKRIEKQLQKDKQTYRATHRLLLLGNQVVLIVWFGVFNLCFSNFSLVASKRESLPLRSIPTVLLNGMTVWSRNRTHTPIGWTEQIDAVPLFYSYFTLVVRKLIGITWHLH